MAKIKDSSKDSSMEPEEELELDDNSDSTPVVEVDKKVNDKPKVNNKPRTVKKIKEGYGHDVFMAKLDSHRAGLTLTYTEAQTGMTKTLLANSWGKVAYTNIGEFNYLMAFHRSHPQILAVVNPDKAMSVMKTHGLSEKQKVVKEAQDVLKNNNLSKKDKAVVEALIAKFNK